MNTKKYLIGIKNKVEVTLAIDLKWFRYLSGVRIWSYNEILETSYAGVEAMKLYLGGKLLFNYLQLCTNHKFS